MNVRRILDVGLATCHTFVFAMLPLVVVASTNGELDTSIGSALLIVAACTAAALWMTRFFSGSLHARASWLSTALILLGGYGTLIELARPSDAGRLIQRPSIAFLYTLGAFLAALIVRRPWDQTRKQGPALTILAFVLLAQGMFPLIAMRGEPATMRRARSAAQEMIEAAVAPSTAVSHSTPTRDIYFIVLDGLGREDTLRGLYGVDSDLATFLRARGFYVPARARSAYGQTALSLASTLNMSYLDPISDAAPKGSSDRDPVDYLIEHNAMMTSARRAGYKVVVLGSEFPETTHFAAADDVVAMPGGLTEVEEAAARMTPLAAVIPTATSREAHRQNVLRQFQRLMAPFEETGPTFVFAHILAPHPPFVFEADGTPQASDSPDFTFADGDHLSMPVEDYRNGYARQVRFVQSQIKKVVQSILDRPGPTPVIVITGDHGPASQLRWQDPGATNLLERMRVFSAYLFPGAPNTDLYDTVSQVNAARVLSNRYLGTRLPRVEDRSAFSTWDEPFEFIPVP